MSIYVHYGHKEFSPEFFEEPKNLRHGFKPHGGMWASPVDAKRGWKNWSSAESLCQYDQENNFRFSLSENANVLHIRKTEDLDALPRCATLPGFWFPKSYVYLDFEKIKASGYDAIELHFSESEANLDLKSDLPWLRDSLIGWDCDCILILNKDVVCPVMSRSLDVPDVLLDKKPSLDKAFLVSIKSSPSAR